MKTGDIIIETSTNQGVFVHWNVAPNTEQVSPEWYVDLDNKTVAYVYSATGTIAVKCCGELSIEVVHSDGKALTITKKSDFKMWGLTTDAQLDEFVKTQKSFVYKKNPWFEVIDTTTGTRLVVKHDILEAVKFALGAIGTL